MRFSHKDKKDPRVSKQSTYAFDFPHKLDQAPEEQGVFILLNDNDDVLYVGHTQTGDFKQSLPSLIDHDSAKSAVTYRWFITDNEQTAETLAQDWINKYQPANQ